MMSLLLSSTLFLPYVLLAFAPSAVLLNDSCPHPICPTCRFYFLTDAIATII